jgi:hypothetical protein
MPSAKTPIKLPTQTLMSKAANDLAAKAPLLDRQPLRTLANALKYASFQQAARFAFPNSTTADRMRVAIKLAAHLVKKANAGCSAGSSSLSPGPTGTGGNMTMSPKTTTTMSFAGSPGSAARFGK